MTCNPIKSIAMPNRTNGSPSIIPTLARTISVYLCLFSFFVWILSTCMYFQWDFVVFSPHGVRYTKMSVHTGSFVIDRFLDDPGLSGLPVHSHGISWGISPGAPNARFWFVFKTLDMQPAVAWNMIVPLWAPFVACVTLLLILRLFRSSRYDHCTCGYNLTGLIDVERCPECGRAICTH